MTALIIEELVGNLPDDWAYSTLGDFCLKSGGNIQTGPFGSQLHASDYVPYGIPSVMPQNIGDNRVIEDGIARVSMADAERLERYRVRVGDIVYSRRGDVEKRALIREHEDGWLCGTGCLRVRFGVTGPDSRFMSYYLGHPAVREWITRHAQGATMLNLNTSILSALPVLLPPLAEQRAIAHLLGTLDDKIELNRRMNETLEAMARALFKSWFVDFDPVRAKADGRQPAGMDAATAALFPDSFEDSELGPIPTGWPVQRLGEHVDAVRGLSYTGTGLSDEGVPLYNLDSILEGGGFKEAGMKFYTGDYQERHQVQSGDLLVANTEQGFDFLLIGFPALVPRRYRSPALFSHHLYRLRSKPDSPLRASYLYFGLLEGPLREQVTACTNGTTVNMLAMDGLQRPVVSVPSRKLAGLFAEFATPLLGQIETLEEQNVILVQLRDSLLPKLLSGEIRAKEIEKVVEAVS